MGAVAKAVGNRGRRLRRDDGIASGGEVNHALGRRLTEGLPPVDLAHADLAGGEQGPEQHGGRLGGGQRGLRLDAPLGAKQCFAPSCSRSIAFVVRADFHWLEGSRVKANNCSPASSRLSATARHFSRPFRRNARRRASISFAVSA